MITLKQIPRCKLKKNRWYLGRGRNSNVGLWNGKCFLTICKKFNMWVIKYEGYYSKKYGCFQPFLLIDEGKTDTAKNKKNIGWDAHYGTILQLK